MVLTFLPLFCLTSVISFVGGFFFGDLEARHELVYYHQLINRSRNTHNLPRAQ